MTKLDRNATLIVAVAATMLGCSRPSTNSPLFGKYAAAACVPFSATPKVQPYAREWDTVPVLSDGTQVTISAAQTPGRGVGVQYGGSETWEFAAAHRDYVYPADIRIDGGNDLLYTKTSGWAGGIWHETWLFEFDLRQRRISNSALVADKALPGECRDPRLP
jgi:hypothetical protein